MKSSFIKDIFREIGKSKSRFFSIFAIIALGSGFFAGLNVTSPDMLETLEKYFREQNLMDIRLVSTYGFSEGDIEALGESEGIREVYPSFSKDVFIESEATNYIAKVMALPESGMNEPVLLEGRLPEKADECLVEHHDRLPETFGIGDKISFSDSDPDDPLGDSLENTEFTVVGVVMSPQYISFDRGRTTIGDGKADTFIMIPEENFLFDVYTEVYLTLDSTRGIPFFSDEYTEKTDAAAKSLEAVADEREAARLDEIRKAAYESVDEGKAEIAKAQKELEDAQAELSLAYDELTAAEKELADGKREYEEGLVQLEEGRKTLEQELINAELRLSSAKREIEAGWEEYEAGKAELEAGKAQLENSLSAFGITIGGINSYINFLEESIAFLEKLPGTQLIIAGYRGQIEMLGGITSAYDQILAGEAELAGAYETLKNAESQTAAGWAELSVAKTEGEAALAEAEKELEKGKAELEKGERELAKGWEEYNSGLAEFNSAKAEAEAEIAKARKDIEKAEREIAELEAPVWYIFSRKDEPGFRTYETDVNIVERIGKVFPVFFMLVAMLVCLTTMTRMVEEQRTAVGTMKALGYGNGAIISKYIIYSALASTSGSVVGIALCVWLFPEIIYTAYCIMYIIPDLLHIPAFGTWVVITLISVLCTCFAAFVSCRAELRECPAELMRPKAPKAGKRVLLEKIPFIWKRLSFNRKVTVRNLFRYKKRIFMTVLGIAGCSALTLTGLGIHTSVSEILEKQYNEIFRYDLIVSLDEEAGYSVTRNALRTLWKNENAEKNLEMYLADVDYKGIGDTMLAVTSDEEMLEEMVVFRERKTAEEFSLSDEGVIITERFAQLSGLSAGDEFTFLAGEEEFSVKVSAVAENYANHFIYMTEGLFEEIRGEKPEYNSVFTVLSDKSEKAREELASALNGTEGVLALTFSEDTRGSFSDTVENLGYVVVLIIVCAAALAFVVLYNLTNINITERIREIATIKVLGFYDREVSDYIFRENFILTFMGASVGLVLGIWLHKFLIGMIQTENIMFGQELPAWTFFAALGITLFFGVAVNRIMFFRLKKISMVESLKSVE